MQDFFANCATVLQKYGFSYLRGAGTTLLLALVGTFFGCLIGFAVGALQTIPVDKQRDPVWKRVLLKILHIFLRCYVELFRGTPMIVQAVFIYYGLLQVFGIKMGMWQAGFFIVSINTGAYMAETVRGGIVSIDPGQTEGAKAISWHLANILGLDPHEPNRVTFDEITKKGVQKGMANPRAIDEDLFNAQQARRILDRLVGYKLSPFLWRKVRRGLSAGRVQSVAVRLIDDREKEIENFKPEEYWNVDATLGTGHKSFTARLASDSTGKKLLPKNEAEARAIEKGLEGAEYTVGELKKGKRAKQPTPAFITSTLQQEASRRLGFTATRTMRAAQTLYEGVDIAGHGTMGLITYMRTDSLRISDEAVAAAKEYIADAYGEQYICPYMAPEPFRGRRCDPSLVPYVAKKIADLRGIPAEEVARATESNARRVFRL